jgi:hypothetical protein
MICPYLKSRLFSSNGIPRVCFYICSTERNSELFFLPVKCSEGNSETLLLFLFNGPEFRVFSLPRKGSERNFEGFLFRGTTGISSEITFCSVYSVFRGISFWSEIPNPTYKGKTSTLSFLSVSLRETGRVKHCWKYGERVGESETLLEIWRACWGEWNIAGNMESVLGRVKHCWKYGERVGESETLLEIWRACWGGNGVGLRTRFLQTSRPPHTEQKYLQNCNYALLKI